MAREAYDKRCELGVAVAAAATCVAAWILILLRTTTRSTSPAAPSSLLLLLPRRFRLRDLHLSSSRDSLRLAHGSAFRASSLYDGSLATIHRLNRLRRPQEPAFLADLAPICSLRHQGLACLQGWCLERGQAMLVYPSLPWSLEGRLFGGRARAALDGEARLKILSKVGEVLAYMHEKGFLHTAMGLESVMLGEEKGEEVKIEGAGIASRLVANEMMMMMKDGGDAQEHWVKKPHVAPEIRYTGKATEKADVYSFGMLALQLACGRRAVHGDFHLLPWLYLLHSNGVHLAHAIDRSILTCTTPLPSSIPTSSSPSFSSLPPFPLAEQQQQSQGQQHKIPSSSSSSSSASPPAAPPPLSSSAALHYPTKITPTDDHILGSTHDQLRPWLCVIHLGLLCCHPLIEARPTMRQALVVLHETRILPLPPSLPDITCWGLDSSAQVSDSIAVELT